MQQQQQFFNPHSSALPSPPPGASHLEQLSAIVNSKDPFVALSFCRALIAAYGREDDHRHLRMQRELNDWLQQRKRQTATLVRVLDRLSGMGGGAAGGGMLPVPSSLAPHQHHFAQQQQQYGGLAPAMAAGAPPAAAAPTVPSAAGGGARSSAAAHLPSISEDSDGGVLSDSSNRRVGWFFGLFSLCCFCVHRISQPHLMGKQGEIADRVALASFVFVDRFPFIAVRDRAEMMLFRMAFII
jgi:hypothetical protein